MIQKYWENRVFDFFLEYRIPHNVALKYMIVEIGSVWDGVIKKSYPRHDNSIAKDEAIKQIVSLHKNFKDGYEGLFNDYWPDEDIQKMIEKGVSEFIEKYGEPYKAYFT